MRETSDLPPTLPKLRLPRGLGAASMSGPSLTAPSPAVPATTAAPATSAKAAVGALGGAEHPLMAIPFTLVIDGRQYMGDGLSLVEAQAHGLADPALDGARRVARLNFAFQGFWVSIHPQVRINLLAPDRLQLAFEDPTGDHLPQLRHILNEYISGDLASVGPVLRANVGADAAKPPRSGAARGGAAGRLAGGLGVLILSLGLVGAAAALVRTQLLVTRLDVPGRVLSAGETLRATASGQISFIDLKAQQGDVAFVIDTTGGEALMVTMPCDCTATPAGVGQGGTVLAGEPVLRVAPADAPRIIEARLPDRLLAELGQGARLEAELPDGGLVPLTLDPARTGAGERPLAILQPATPLPAELAGLYVGLRIDRIPAPLTDWMAGLFGPDTALAPLATTE